MIHRARLRSNHTNSILRALALSMAAALVLLFAIQAVLSAVGAV